MTISRYSYDDDKNWFSMQSQEDMPVLDDEETRSDEMHAYAMRRSITELIGNGSATSGFILSGSALDPDIAAGNIYVCGLRVEIPSALTESTQPDGTQSPPAGDGLWYLKITPTLEGIAEDPFLENPAFPGIESVKMWTAKWTLLKVLGGAMPAPGADEYHIEIATEATGAFTDTRNTGNVAAGANTGFNGREGVGFSNVLGHSHSGGGPPGPHAPTHLSGGSDPIDITLLQNYDPVDLPTALTNNPVATDHIVRVTFAQDYGVTGPTARFIHNPATPGTRATGVVGETNGNTVDSYGVWGLSGQVNASGLYGENVNGVGVYAYGQGTTHPDLKLEHSALGGALSKPLWNGAQMALVSDVAPPPTSLSDMWFIDHKHDAAAPANTLITVPANYAPRGVKIMMRCYIQVHTDGSAGGAWAAIALMLNGTDLSTSISRDPRYEIYLANLTPNTNLGLFQNVDCVLLTGDNWTPGIINTLRVGNAFQSPAGHLYSPTFAYYSLEVIAINTATP